MFIVLSIPKSSLVPFLTFQVVDQLQLLFLLPKSFFEMFHIANQHLTIRIEFFGIVISNTIKNKLIRTKYIVLLSRTNLYVI